MASHGAGQTGSRAPGAFPVVLHPVLMVGSRALGAVLHPVLMVGSRVPGAFPAVLMSRSRVPGGHFMAVGEGMGWVSGQVVVVDG